MTEDIRFQFFPAKKRAIILESWSPKKNNENEKRVLFKFKLPITGESFEGFPEFLTEGFHAVEKERGSGTFSSDIILEQMSMDFYDTDTSAEKVQRATGLTLQKFELSREKEKDSYVTVLRLEYNVPWFKGLWRFVDRYWGCKLWCDFVPSPDFHPIQDEKPPLQMRIGDQPEPETEEDNEDDSESSLPEDEQTEERAEAVADIKPEEVSKTQTPVDRVRRSFRSRQTGEAVN